MVDKSDLKFILGIVLFFGSFAIAMLGYGNEVTGEQLCVDGNQNINLEGMMCEKTIDTFFGLNIYFMYIILIPIVIGIIFITDSMFGGFR